MSGEVRALRGSMSEGLPDGENRSRTERGKWDSTEASAGHQSTGSSSTNHVKPTGLKPTNHKLSPEIQQGSAFSSGLDGISHGVVRVR